MGLPAVQMETLLIRQGDVTVLLKEFGGDKIMDMVIERLDLAFRLSAETDCHTPARDGFVRPQVAGVLEWMTHHQRGDAVTIKSVAYSPRNPVRHELPTITGVVARFDDETGCLTALTDGIFLTAVRTGAASAIASRLLAEPNSRVLGLVGAGAQAVTQAHAMSRVFPLTRILVHDTDPAHAASFAGRVGFLGLDVRVVSLTELEAASDIICTATSVEVNAGPVIQGVNLTDHVHINAIGADLPGKIEVPVHVLRNALVVPDHIEQARREGECQQLPDVDMEFTLSDLCRQPDIAQAYRGRRTVFDSTGFALEDHVALDVVLELATAAGVGQSVRLEYLPSDVLDPYCDSTR